MSERTPNSSEDSAGAEPSMEDILASIRKIISEDEPVAMGSPEDMTVQPIVDPAFGSVDLSSNAEMDEFVAVAQKNAVEPESVDLNIDDVLAGLSNDVDVLDMPAVEDVALDTLTETVTASDMADMTFEADVMSVEEAPLAPEGDILAFLDNDDMLSFLDDADAAIETEAALAPTPEIQAFEDNSFTVDNADDEMSALLEDILLEPEEAVMDVSGLTTEFSSEFPVEPEVEAFVAPVFEQAEPQQIESVRVESGEDLDLVKSLMADLADDPDAMALDEDLDALLEIPEMEEVAVEGVSADDFDFEDLDLAALDDENLDAQDMSSDDDALDTADKDEAEAPSEDVLEDEIVEEDILGDILDMTLEDELQAQPDDIPLDDIFGDDVLAAEALTHDDVAALEELNISENLDESVDVLDEATDVVPSLADIAAAAEADAIAIETPSHSTSASIGLAALTGAGVAALSTKAVDATVEPADITPADNASHQDALTETTPTQNIPSQETTMPVKAVNTDTILDEVTETATAGAFAQLNTVVEDKAIFNERGPRIGDLVQDALRPMLKEWLDSNLKGIVERAVAKEVKRISSGK